MVKVAGCKTRVRSIAHSEVSLSNDFRGGIFGIRENGRFESSPLEDDYDN